MVNEDFRPVNWTKPFSLSNGIGFTGVYGVMAMQDVWGLIAPYVPAHYQNKSKVLPGWGGLGIGGLQCAQQHFHILPTAGKLLYLWFCAAIGRDALIVQSCLLFSWSFCLLRQRTIVSLLPQHHIIAGHSITTFSGFISKTLLEIFI